jgi:hypothetical protein
MSYVQKPSISSIIYLNNAYGSDASSQYRAYIDHVLIKHCREHGLDDQGAEVAEVL